MKKLGLEVVREGLNFSAEDKEKSNAEIVKAMIEGLIMSYAQKNRGLAEGERRTYYKILDKFDALDKDAVEIELEDDWMGFIRKCKKETPMMPNRLLQQIEDLIEAVQDR